MTPRVTVIGVGPEGVEGLGPEARARLRAADRVLGGARLLEQVPDRPPVREVLPAGGLAEAVRALRDRPEGERVVLLASGDPLFHGVGATLLDALPADDVEVLPAVTSLQAAFALARMPWHDASLASAHARPAAQLVGLSRRHRRLGILTDPSRTPGRIAALLLAAGVADCRAVVVEDIGGPEQAVTDATLASLEGREFHRLNVLLVDQGPAWRPGPLGSSRPDAAYQHQAGLITKRDVRRLALDRLVLGESDTAWDVGAGIGAMSIEMAELAWRGRVFAVERESARCRDIEANIARFGVPNVELVEGAAPEALGPLPTPDAAFIGGTGGSPTAVLEAVAARAAPGCRVVATFAVLEHMAATHAWLQAAGWAPDLVEVSLAHGAPLGRGTRLVPATPVFIVSAVAPGLAP